MALESPQGQGDYLGRQLLVHGRFVPAAEVVERIEAVTVDAARAAGRALLAHPGTGGDRRDGGTAAQAQSRRVSRAMTGLGVLVTETWDDYALRRFGWRAEARTLWPISLHPARSAGAVAAGQPRMAGRWRIHRRPR